MTRLLSLAGLLFIGFAMGAAYVAQPQLPDALFCETPILDLGELRQKQEATGSFLLVNGTRRKAHILRISESCACSVSHVSAETLEPGGQSEITVTWNTGNSRGKSHVTLWADCAFDDGTGGAIMLILTGNIVPEYDVEPLEPDFEIGVCEKVVVAFTPNQMEKVSTCQKTFC